MTFEAMADWYYLLSVCTSAFLFSSFIQMFIRVCISFGLVMMRFLLLEVLCELYRIKDR